MARRKKAKIGEKEAGKGMERWLITYADLITLLLVFFIIMYAMSRVDDMKYKALSEALSVVLTGQPTAGIMDFQGPSFIPGKAGEMQINPDGTVSAKVLSMEEIQLEDIQDKIEDFLLSREVEQDFLDSLDSDELSSKLGDFIVLIEQERGLVISFKDALLFPSASDELTPTARDIVRQIGGNLTNIPNIIRVEGHTDDLAINSELFSSNWELSVLRASNVVDVLQNDVGITPQRLSIIGYGEHRPLVSNEDSRGRAMNRRVDIVILKQQYNYFEAQ